MGTITYFKAIIQIQDGSHDGSPFDGHTKWTYVATNMPPLLKVSAGQFFRARG